MKRRLLSIGAAMAGALAFAAPASGVTTAAVSGMPGSPAGQTLTVTGSTGNDVITVSWNGAQTGDYRVVDPAGVTAAAGCVAVTPTEATCSRNNAVVGDWLNPFIVSIVGDAGDDLIRHVQDIDNLDSDEINIDGGAGNDDLGGSRNSDRIGGGPGNDLVDGNAGDDTLSGFSMPVGLLITPEGAFTSVGDAGTDTIYGGPGSDQMSDGDNDSVPAQLNADSLNGQVCPLPACALPPYLDEIEDHDGILWGQRTLPVVVDLRLTTAQGATGEGELIADMEGIAGGAGNDTLIGTEAGAVFRDDSLRGNNGNDLLEGLGGDDELLGGGGADTIRGGGEADAINPGGNGVLGGVWTNDGPDVIDGGGNRPAGINNEPAGNDLLIYEYRTDALTIDLPAGIGGAAGENDTFVNIEDVMGGHSGDTITGLAGVPNLITGDPPPYVPPLPGEPPNPPDPPGGFTGPDTINTRDDGPDVVDCSGGIDTFIGDITDAQVNCENVDVPAAPPPPPAPPKAKPADTKPGTTDKPTIGGEGGGKSAGSSGSGAGSSSVLRVRSNGTFRLSAFVITCPDGGAPCKVTTTVARNQSVRIGSLSYRLAAGAKGAARSRLSKKGMKLLKKRGSIKALVTIKVSVGTQTTTKKVSVTLKR